MNDSDDDREKKDFDDEESLLVPAGPVRVVLGLTMMAGGVFAAALSDKSWVKTVGFILFLVSGLVMVKSADRKDGN